jgi:hypothetical protein
LSKEDEERRLARNDGPLLTTPNPKNPKKRKIVAELEGASKLGDRPLPGSSSDPPSTPLKPSRRRKPTPEDDDLEMTIIPTSDADENELDTSANLGCPRRTYRLTYARFETAILPS